MKYTLLLILLLASPMGFSQKPTHHIYTFDGIVRKPWSFYHIINGEFVEFTEKEVSKGDKDLDYFVTHTRDITIDCFSHTAKVTILNNSETTHYILNRVKPNKYIYKDAIVNLMLITKSSLICEFYFIKGDKATSVSNMDWEMAQ